MIAGPFKHHECYFSGKNFGFKDSYSWSQWPLFSICHWHKLTLTLLVKKDRWKMPGSTGSTCWRYSLLPSQRHHFQGFSSICISLPLPVPGRNPCRWFTVHALLLWLNCKKIVPKPYIILWLLYVTSLQYGRSPRPSHIPWTHWIFNACHLSGWPKTERLKESVLPVIQNALFEKQGNN